MRHEQKGAFSQDKVMDNGVSDAQIPTRSLCLSSVLVVFLQPGCHTVDPEEERWREYTFRATHGNKLYSHYLKKKWLHL